MMRTRDAETLATIAGDLANARSSLLSAALSVEHGMYPMAARSRLDAEISLTWCVAGFAALAKDTP